MGRGIIQGGGEKGLYSVQIQLETGSIQDSASVPENPTVEMWCADLTEDLAGEVGIMEIAGLRINDGNIQPGYEGNAVYNEIRDGQLKPAAAVGAPEAYFNWALQGGWQKWMPTYRWGVITDIDYDADTCDVALDPQVKPDTGLSVNQSETLTNVPVEYMECNSKAFETGDAVVIHFEGFRWGSPKVIGFKQEPKACEFYIELRINGHTPTLTKTLRIVDDEGKQFTASSTEEEPWKIGPFQGNIAWPAKIYLVGEVSYFKADPNGEYYAYAFGFNNNIGECFRCGLALYDPALNPESYEIFERCRKITDVLGGIYEEVPESIEFTIYSLTFKWPVYNNSECCGKCSLSTTSIDWHEELSLDHAGENIEAGCGYGEDGCDGIGSLSDGCTEFKSHTFAGLSSIVIVSDEDGLNPTFLSRGATWRAFSLFCYSYIYHEEEDEYETVCEYENETLDPSGEILWGMHLVPATYI